MRIPQTDILKVNPGRLVAENQLLSEMLPNAQIQDNFCLRPRSLHCMCEIGQMLLDPDLNENLCIRIIIIILSNKSIRCRGLREDKDGRLVSPITLSERSNKRRLGSSVFLSRVSTICLSCLLCLSLLPWGIIFIAGWQASVHLLPMCICAHLFALPRKRFQSAPTL